MTGEYNGCRLIPAADTNYRRGRIRTIDRIIIHVTQSNDMGAVTSWFATPRPKAPSSAHYTVDKNGDIVQHVREGDTAYAAPNYNARGIHIEHVGWVDKTTFPGKQLEASARLVRHLCAKYGIAPDRVHVLGHSELEGNDHTDPGSKWPWKLYMALVRGTGPLPQPLWLHKDGLKVKGATVFGLAWPKGTAHTAIVADGRWLVWNGAPDAKIKLQFHQEGPRSLVATAYGPNHEVLAKDELDILVVDAA